MLPAEHVLGKRELLEGVAFIHQLDQLCCCRFEVGGLPYKVVREVDYFNRVVVLLESFEENSCATICQVASLKVQLL